MINSSRILSQSIKERVFAIGQHLHYSKMTLHYKCRNTFYPRTDNKIMRSLVPDDKVAWTTSFLDYSPVNYTMELILISPPAWADAELNDKSSPKWNTLDGQVNRKSHEATYQIVNSCPLNVRGRTGLTGRGCLGRWGPNHAADPIVTRWKLCSKGEKIIHEKSGKPILQFVCIQRRDNNQWAIPGGMVDPGETITTTLKREFLEEAMDSIEMSDSKKKAAEEELKDLFTKGNEVYSGYVDDPRNTDNSWMETVAFNFHGGDEGILYSLQLQAGDDAKAVKWLDISGDLDLYASHRDFIEKVASIHQAHW